MAEFFDDVIVFKIVKKLLTSAYFDIQMGIFLLWCIEILQYYNYAKFCVNTTSLHLLIPILKFADVSKIMFMQKNTDNNKIIT